jgi:aspartate/methionine/tyrosine aminotransferase
MQRAAIPLLEEKLVLDETNAIHETFAPKRDYLLRRLREVGVRFDAEPEGTFYAWGDLRDLPPSLRHGDDFFQAALDRKVITVPGHFFDINPGKRRMGRPSRFRHHVRFSFGPGLSVLEEAMDRIAAMVREAR